jgi:RNA-directed DNA polymerase
VTIEQFEERLADNLYRLWNRMSSGSYFPGPVRAVEIPKKGGTRILGIPNVVDRIAQSAAVLALEPEVEKVFHDDSYGYRPGRSQVDAVRVCRQRCFKKDWVVDLDVKAFFDSVPWDLMLKAVARHMTQQWVLLYVEFWLKAPMLMPDGTLTHRTKGTPQGGPISPLIANIFLHYGFDTWMNREFPGVGFERFADDVVAHCVTERQAHQVRWDKIRRRARTGFLPAVAPGKLTDMSRKVVSWRLHRRTIWSLDDLAEDVNPVLRGWLNYFTAFYPSAVIPIGKRVDRHLMRWARWKYKRLERSEDRTRTWLKGVWQRSPNLFAHWTLRYTT